MGIKIIEKIGNEETRATTGVTNINQKIREARLRWLGHVERETEENVLPGNENMEVAGYRKIGRPKLMWIGVTVVPVFSGHPSFPAKVSLHCRCPLIRGVQIYNNTWREF